MDAMLVYKKRVEIFAAAVAVACDEPTDAAGKSEVGATRKFHSLQFRTVEAANSDRPFRA